MFASDEEGEFSWHRQSAIDLVSQPSSSRHRQAGNAERSPSKSDASSSRPGALCPYLIIAWRGKVWRPHVHRQFENNSEHVGCPPYGLCGYLGPGHKRPSGDGTVMTKGAGRLTYEIRVRGELNAALVAALQALNLHIEQTDNDAILVGVFRDQAELHGALQAMQDFGVELVEVRQRSRWTSAGDAPTMRNGASSGD
jgi:hypothetical protein